MQAPESPVPALALAPDTFAVPDADAPDLPEPAGPVLDGPAPGGTATAGATTAASPEGAGSASVAPGGVLVSVVVPVRNEAANIAPLIGEIRAALAGTPHEIVYVDDGSTDETAAMLRAAARAAPLTIRRHRTGCGQSAAIITGIVAAAGTWVATLDGDGQNDPADIPALLARAQGLPALSLVAGHRTARRDSRIKRLSSRAANAIRARLLGDATPDTGCGLKVFRRADFLALPAFDHMHRFLPALFIRAGGQVVSVPVGHRPRTRGASKYGTLDRLWVGVFDLVGVAWLQRRWTRPELESREIRDENGT